MAVTVNGSRFLIGDFINTLLSFLILAAVVYFLVGCRSAVDGKYQTAPQPAPTKECLSKIPKLARRCAHCTGSSAARRSRQRCGAGRAIWRARGG